MTADTTQSSLLGKIAAYTEILQKDPRSTIFVPLSEAYRKMGHLDDARQIVEEGISLYPDFCPAYIVLARILCQQSDYKASDIAFSKALQLDENSLAGLVGYARLLVLINKTDKAKQLLLRARNLSPADPVINKFLNSLPPSKEDTGSVAGPQGGLSTPLISETLADLYLKQGLPDKALDIFRELLRKDPDNLKIRRRIRDVEIVVQGESVQTESSTASDVLLDEPQQGPRLEDETPSLGDDSSPELEIAEAVPDVMDESIGLKTVPDDYNKDDLMIKSDLSPLGVLNYWLENIQKRRQHV